LDPSRAQAVFDKESYNSAISTRGVYQCAGNIFWLNFSRLISSQGVPISPRAIEQLKKSHFSSPEVNQNIVIVPVQPGLSYRDLKNQFNNLVRCSPEEIEFALISRIAELVRSNADEVQLTLGAQFTK